MRLVRELVRASTKALLLERARDGLRELLDEVASVARDDAGPDEARAKAAEFILQLRGRRDDERALAQLVNAVAEAAARTRYRSARVVDYLSFWLFVLGEQFVAGLGDPAAVVELEAEHAGLWNRFRGELLELLETGTQRLRAGRRVRLAEGYLARFRLVRARFDEHLRAEALRAAAPQDEAPARPHTDYVAAMAVDLFALTLSDLQQRLVIAQIPAAAGTRGKSGFAAADHQRLWAPLRAVRPDQGFARWHRLVRELRVPERQAVQELCRGAILHLQRTWDWFFPERRPYGTVRAALRDLELLGADAGEGADVAAKAFHRYAQTLAFTLRLATEDCESTSMSFDLDDPTGGSF